MNFKLWKKELGEKSAITIRPLWSFKEDGRLIDAQLRSLEGRLFNYVWGSYRTFKIPLKFVDSQQRNILTEWWKKQSLLTLQITTENGKKDLIYCRLLNKSLPLSGLSIPYTELYEGELQLEEVYASSSSN